MTNYNVQINRWSQANLVYDQLYPRNMLYGTTAPTVNTVGIVGQHYIWTNAKPNPIDFVCSEISGSNYIWVPSVPYSNENLLDNWDFRNPVNQRNVSNSWEANKYGIDRWKSYNSTIVVSDGYITTGLDNFIYQIMDSDTTNLLVGKTLTLSMMLLNGVIVQGTISSFATGSDIFVVNTSDYRLGWWNGIGGAWAFDAKNVGIKAVKLELGSVSTLANDPPADYGEELRKCQRYYRLIDVIRGNTNTLTPYIPIFVHYDDMRTSPVVSSVGIITDGGSTEISETIVSTYFTKNSGNWIELSASRTNDVIFNNVALSADL